LFPCRLSSKPSDMNKKSRPRSADSTGVETLPPTDEAASEEQFSLQNAKSEQDSTDRPTAQREVRYRHSVNFVPLLRSLGSSLLVSTYSAGKLAVIGTSETGLELNFLNFQNAMGVAIGPDRIAVGAGGQIWFLSNNASLTAQLPESGRHDGCFLARNSFLTGGIEGHEIVWVDGQLWVVNTAFSCLCTLDPEYSFVPQWKPSFISELRPGDRCHLNGLALENGRPRYVSAMSQTNTPGGWRPTKAESGCVIDIATDQIVATGFAMPHSPRVHNDCLFVLNSGHGTLETIDRETGKSEAIESVPGYARGLAMVGPFAFVGMSQIRETSVFGGIPIAEKRDELRCGVAVIDLRTGNSIAYLEFLSGVQEIFDVQIASGLANPFLSGPYAAIDRDAPLWVVPPMSRSGS